MNIWVEWFRQNEIKNDTWAQMKEPSKWIPPKPSEINRRFFDKQEDAAEYAKRMNEKGYHASIKRDGVGA